VTEVKGFLVARIVGGDRAEVEETPGRLDLEVSLGDRSRDTRHREGCPEEQEDQRALRLFRD